MATSGEGIELEQMSPCKVAVNGKIVNLEPLARNDGRARQVSQAYISIRRTLIQVLLLSGLQVALSQIIHFLKHLFMKITHTFDKNKAQQKDLAK